MFRGSISAWLLHEDQKELFEILVALVLTVVFLVLIAPLLWLMGTPVLMFQLAKGYGSLWIITMLTLALLHRLHRLFRIDLYHHADAYIISNLAISCILQTGWAAFAALRVQSVVVGPPSWMVIILYLIGFVSCLIAYFTVSSWYHGHIYRMISLPLALVSFVVFCVWPASGRVLYGWFFDLF